MTDGRSGPPMTGAMMNEKQQINTAEGRFYNSDQYKLIAEISSTYGTEPDDILFFTDEPNPFFGFETSCVMLNRLASPKAIDIEPIDSVSPDSLSIRCQIYFADGTNFSAVGVANRNEEIDGRKVNDQQLNWLASSRALRSTLRISGRNLLKLHQAAKEGTSPELQFTGFPRSNRQSLSAEAHALGKELGFIDGEDKSIWQRVLNNRYEVDSSARLTDPELADLVAFLKSVKRRPAMKAAA
jgi:hypothetical protein